MSSGFSLFEINVISSIVIGVLFLLASKSISLSIQRMLEFTELFTSLLFLTTLGILECNENPQDRWFATDINASTYPEFIAGNAPASGEITITEMVAESHGAKIYVGAGFGADAVTRRNEVVSSQRYKLIYTIP
ncbi:MAG: hypothetical protein ACXVCR_19810 [Bdellovibrio sp.]